MIDKTWRIEPDALREAEEASDHYESERPGHGDKFSEAVRATFLRLEQTPRVGNVERHRSFEIRRAQIAEFPYWMVNAELDDEFVVVAIMYGGRNPNYWRKRLRAFR
jgi:plasmid stabilization system protein ParE